MIKSEHLLGNLHCTLRLPLVQDRDVQKNETTYILIIITFTPQHPRLHIHPYGKIIPAETS